MSFAERLGGIYYGGLAKKWGFNGFKCLSN